MLTRELEEEHYGWNRCEIGCCGGSERCYGCKTLWTDERDGCEEEEGSGGFGCFNPRLRIETQGTQ